MKSRANFHLVVVWLASDLEKSFSAISFPKEDVVLK